MEESIRDKPIWVKCADCIHILENIRCDRCEECICYNCVCSPVADPMSILQRKMFKAREREATDMDNQVDLSKERTIGEVVASMEKEIQKINKRIEEIHNYLFEKEEEIPDDT